MSITPRKLLEDYDRLVEKHGSQRQLALHYGIPRTTIQAWLLNRQQILFSESSPQDATVVPTPKRGVKRFIFTAAQDNTAVHEDFLANLEAYADHLGAKLVIAGFTYDKRLFQEHRKNQRFQHYEESVRPYMHNHRIELGNNLMFCGEMNTLPTAVAPLTGFETYTREKWGIFPHAKVQLVSVPTMKHVQAKQIMTTGAVTKPNYVQKRAGIRAHFHHVYGAVIVEIDDEGNQFCRHLLGDKEDGSFFDLTTHVIGGRVYVDQDDTVEAITWGDIHFEKIDPLVAFHAMGIRPELCATDAHDMLSELQPNYQFVHDVTDFAVRNHHNIKDPHFRIRMFYNGTDSVEESLQGVAHFLAALKENAPQSQVVVVESNHDLALTRWLKEADWKVDPVNAEFYLRMQLACVQAIAADEHGFRPLEFALKGMDSTIEDVKFLGQDDSFVTCGEIENGIHGHNGANGSKGSLRQFAKMGPKAWVAHAHSCGIFDGIYQVGTSSRLDLGFNAGLSSWSHTHGITYRNGKRTLITMQNGKWHA